MSRLIISKSKFLSNIALLKDNIDTNIASVIKDNAYGHGIHEISDLLMECGIDIVFVKNNAEAHIVRDKFSHITILYPDSYDDIPQNVYVSVQNLESIAKIPQHTGIELKVNTGMNRNGIDVNDLSRALRMIAHKKLRLVGVFTHNGYGDDDGISSDFIAQMKCFENVKKECIEFSHKNNIPVPRFHSLSSSGALKAMRKVSHSHTAQCSADSFNFQESVRDDFVRIGIAMYGYTGTKIDIALEPIAELWADRISTHTLPKGSKIGYGGKSVLECDSVVSSYDIGYGDGFFRLNERHELRTKEGFLILPKMSMDSTSIISSAPSVCMMHDASIIARLFDTISYEVLCKISPSIKRIIKE